MRPMPPNVEVRRGQRWDARPRPQKMYTVPVAGAWWLAVGPRLDRLVRPRLAADRATVCMALNELHEQPAWAPCVANQRGQINPVRDRAIFAKRPEFPC